ncbi:MAG: T9SS C-terminal target domain-containing protein [Bacteroidetes bacterium]|nr:MAG: T9SS C-terminal target domain-containing protein [Bacteroidota bacterium]
MNKIIVFFFFVLVFKPAYSQNEIPIEVNLNNTTNSWVNDSTLFYSGNNGSNWDFNRRSKALKYDDFGNITNIIVHNWNENLQDWEKSDSIWITYYDENSQNEYLKKGWDQQSQSWTGSERYLKLDENGNELILQLIKIVNNQFIFGVNYVNYFNENGNKTLGLTQGLNIETGEWENGFQVLYTYNESESLSIRLHQTWDVAQQGWLNSDQYLFYYNPANILAQEVHQTWNDSNNEWQNHSLELKTNIGDTTTTLIQLWNNLDINWVNEWKEIEIYNAEMAIDYFLKQDWDTDLEEWKNNMQIFFTYNEFNQPIEELSQTWVSEINLWENNEKHSITYDTYGNLNSSVIQTWDVGTGLWKNTSQEMLTFDENNNQHQFISQFWDEDLQEWANNQREDFFWSKFEPNSLQKENQITLQTFPNPTSQKINITGLPAEGYKMISIFNSTGNSVKQNLIQSNNSIDVSLLPKGIYFAHVNCTGKNFFVKFIKQ